MKVSLPDARVSFFLFGWPIWTLDIHDTSRATFMQNPEKLTVAGFIDKVRGRA